MSLNEANYCGAQQEEVIIKKEATKTVEFDDSSSWSISLEMKCENGQDVSSFSSELNNFEKTFSQFPGKHEPEDSQDDDVHQVQPENLELKEEEIDMEEHIPVWELISGTISNVEIFKDGLDLMQKDLLQSSESETSRSEEKAKYNCAHCPYKANKKSSYILHYNCKHKQCTEVYKYNECSYETKIKGAVAKRSTYAPMYKCEECSYEARRKDNLIQHYKCKHLKNSDVYKCRECSYQTRIRHYLTKHHKRKHAKEAEVYKCDECSFETKYKSSVEKHYKYKHSKDAEMFKCEECSLETRYKNFLLEHFKHKHLKDADVFKCQECSFETRIRHYLTRHYKYKHSKDAEVYKCLECSFETKIKCHLTRHFKYKHSNDVEVYKCQKCTFKTIYKRNLVQHEITHIPIQRCRSVQVETKIKCDLAD